MRTSLWRTGSVGLLVGAMMLSGAYAVNAVTSTGPIQACDFDVAWELDEEVTAAEVKSLTEANEVVQLRLGLGQVLHYQDLLRRPGRAATAILFVEGQPADLGWVGLCEKAGVQLLWPESLSVLDGPTQEQAAKDRSRGQA